MRNPAPLARRRPSSSSTTSAQCGHHPRPDARDELYELAAVIARIHPRLRIVLMSGYGDTPDALRGGGIVRVLPKPFTAAGLLGMVTDILSEAQ